MSGERRPTVYEPSLDDPQIVAALAARRRLDEAMARGDEPVIAELFADDFLVHVPSGRILDRRRILKAYSQGGQAKYDTGINLLLDHVAVRGDSVVMMGAETVDPEPPARPIYRRFTDVWTLIDGRWRITIRQATETPPPTAADKP